MGLELWPERRKRGWRKKINESVGAHSSADTEDKTLEEEENIGIGKR